MSRALLALATLFTGWLSAQTVTPDASRLTEVSLPDTPPTLSESAGLNKRAMDEDVAFAPSSTGDSDIGEQLILKEVPKNQPFRFSAGSHLFWTDNAAHTSAGEVEDIFYGWRTALSYQPKITNRLFGDVGVSQDWFRYDQLEALSFESLEANATLLYAVPQLADAVIFTGYLFNHITQDFEELLVSHSIRAGIQKTFLINRRNSLQVGLMGDWDVDNTVAALMRYEYSGNVGWVFKLLQDLRLNLGYRFTYFDYTEVDRQDHLHGLAFGLSYTPWPWAEIYLSATYALNDSNYDVYDYEASNLGGGIGIRIKF